MAKVLVVDDVPDNVKLLAYDLSDHGYEVVTACDGLGALKLAGSERPDVILLDIMMPGINGIEACRRLKADAGLRSIPVILLSALDQQGDIVRRLDAGAHDYITKPFDDRIVLARVRSAVREKAAYDQIAAMNVQVERRLQRIAALRRVDRAITASLDLRVILETLLDQVTVQLGVHAAAVLRLEPQSHTLAYAAGRGFRSPEIAGARLRPGEGHAGRAALERRLVHVPDLSAAGATSGRAPLLEGEAFVAYYAAPLVSKGQVMGVLEVFHRSALEPDPEWLDFLEALAGQAAIAVDNISLFEGLQRANLELTLAYDATIEGWARALDLRDKETEGHSRRVTEMTLRLARAMGMSEAELVHVRRGALLHDVGKLGIPDSVLLKPGPLTEAERQIMERHATYVRQWLEPIAFLRPALEIPCCHHERWDGTGYPRGLEGEQIPLSARIFAVVDVWDALRSDRPYRGGRPEEEVLEHIASLAGTHLDPEVVREFLAIMGGPASRTSAEAGPTSSLVGAGAAMWALLEAAFDHVLLLDEARRIVAASGRLASIIAPGRDLRGSDFTASLDAVSGDRARAVLAALPDPPERSRAVELAHRTSAGAVHPVRYAFCKVATAEGSRVVALGRDREESPGPGERVAWPHQARRDMTGPAPRDGAAGWCDRR